MIYKVEAVASCKFCHGHGAVTEYHPYGDTVAGEDLLCDCVCEQVPEEFDDYKDEIEVVDTGWQDGPEFEYDEELDR